MRSTKDQARTDKALQAIEDCFNPKNKAMGDAASAFYRSIRMLVEKWHKHEPEEHDVREMLSVALKEDYRIAGALNGGALSYGHTLAYKGANQQYSNAFNKLAHATCVELRDYDGSEQQKAVNYVAHALTAHLRDPSLLPKRRQKSLFIMP